MKPRYSFALALIALATLSQMVKAEMVHYGGDGHFCTSKGYLAFDSNQDQDEVTAGRAAKEVHLLKIVRFGPGHRIYFAGEVSLPKGFSSLWMDCNAERIEIAGPIWPRGLNGPFTRCDIKIGSHTSDIGSAQCGDDVIKRGPLTEIPNLYIFPEDKFHPLPLESPDDTDHKYELRLHVTRKLSKNGLESRNKAEVVQLDQKGIAVKRLLIYEGYSFEAAD
jgi:hypothetical protein